MATDSFSTLLNALFEESRRPPPAPPRARSALPAREFKIQSRPDRNFAKAVGAEIAAARANLDAVGNNLAAAALGGLQVGHGARVPGRPEGLRVVDIDPEYGRVAVQQIEDLPNIPGVVFEPAPAVWLHASQIERAPEFDAPGAQGRSFRKALAAVQGVHNSHARLADIRARGRVLVTEARERLEKSFYSGEISGDAVRETEAALNAWSARMGL